MAVMGHVGLTPQSISALGGFRPQGRSSAQAVRILREAHALQAGSHACLGAVVRSSGIMDDTSGHHRSVKDAHMVDAQQAVVYNIIGMQQHCEPKRPRSDLRALCASREATCLAGRRHPACATQVLGHCIRTQGTTGLCHCD